MADNSDVVEFEYENWLGVRQVRRVRPICLFFGSTAHHLQEQWLMQAFDLVRMETRDFALDKVFGPFVHVKKEEKDEH